MNEFHLPQQSIDKQLDELSTQHALSIQKSGYKTTVTVWVEKTN